MRKSGIDSRGYVSSDNQKPKNIWTYDKKFKYEGDKDKHG